MSRRTKKLIASIISYVIGSIACQMYYQWPNFGGHVHIPFSSFPSSLLLAPFFPFAVASSLIGTPAEAIPLLLVFTLAAVASFLILKRVAFNRSEE